MRPEWPPWPMVEGVKPIVGEPMRFMVRSWSDSKQWYLVDLEEAGGHGRCSCHNFEMRCWPRWKQDRSEGKPKVARRCKHIIRAMIWQAERVNRQIAIETNKRTRQEQ